MGGECPGWVMAVVAGFEPDDAWRWRWDPVGPLGAGELVFSWKKASSDVGVTLSGGFLRLDNGVADELFLMQDAHACGKAAKAALYRWQE